MVATTAEKRYVSTEILHPDLVYILQRLEEEGLIAGYEGIVGNKRKPIPLYDEETVGRVAEFSGYKKRIRVVDGVRNLSGKELSYRTTNLDTVVRALTEELRRIDSGEENRVDLLAIAEFEVYDRTDYVRAYPNIIDDDNLRKQIVEKTKEMVRTTRGRCSVDMIFDEIKTIAPVTYAAIYNMALIMLSNYRRAEQSIPKKE